MVEIDVIPGAANANPGIAMWTAATRKNYSRKTVRYQSDVTDEEWRVIEPHLPPARATGRPRAWPLREIVNGIFYVMRSGCAWQQLPTGHDRYLGRDGWRADRARFDVSLIPRSNVASAAAALE